MSKMTETTITWHRLVDGDPDQTGRYIVAHGSFSKLITYWGPGSHGSKRGWDHDVSFATHWAKEPHAPRDGTPQLFTPEGRAARSASDEYTSWMALNDEGSEP